MSGPGTAPLWISSFLEAQAAEVGAARNTLLAYGRDLTDFAAWLAHRSTGFGVATRDDVERYLIHCDDQGLSKATRARRRVESRWWPRGLRRSFGLRLEVLPWPRR